MKKLALALAATAAFAGQAIAADMPARMPAKAAPVVAPVANWTGCYIAGGGGYGLWQQESAGYADEYVRHFLTKEPIPGMEIEYKVAAAYLPTITAEEVMAELTRN